MYSKQEKRQFLLKWGSIYAGCLFISLSIGVLLATAQGGLQSSDLPVAFGIVLIVALIVGYIVALKAWKNYVRANPK